MKILHLDTSIMGETSVTRELTHLIVKTLQSRFPDADITYRDLVDVEVPHLTRANLPTAHRLALDANLLDEEGLLARAQSDAMLSEFQTADTVVIGAPMYNFSVPSQLKSWLDRIMIGGVTFRYGPNGPEGLAVGKRIIVAVARGGFYGSENGEISAEHAERYLRSLFAFIGIPDPEFILADGMGRGEENRLSAMQSAFAAIDQLEG